MAAFDARQSIDSEYCNMFCYCIVRLSHTELCIYLNKTYD